MPGIAEPMLIELPDALKGERVIVRPYRSGDGAALWEAVEESREHVLPWLPWGDSHKSPDDSELFVRRSMAKWILREDLGLSIRDALSDRYLGGTGLHRIKWNVPSFEIGYWLRKSAVGCGYMTEAVQLVTALAFETLGAERVFIRCGANNHRSAAIPTRLGFVHEGTARSSDRDTNGKTYDMMTFAMTREDFTRAQTQGLMRQRLS